MTIDILKYPTEEDWMLCKQAALVTVGKEAVKPPTEKWKHDILEARHSPIRVLNFCFLLTDIPYYVAMHLVRHHEGVQPFVKSQRNDRQGEYDRAKAPQDAPVSLMWYMNAEALMVIANKRLCYQAAPETREVVQAMCQKVLGTCPEFGGLLVPMCIYQGGECHEIKPCTHVSISK